MHEGGPLWERGDQDMLVVGMGAGAARAQAVERRDAQSRREVAVAAAAGRSLGQLEARPARPGELAGFLEEGRVGVVRSIGGRLNDPLSVRRILGIDWARALPSADSIRVSSARVATRTSISAEACAGTTLVVVPPRMTPTLMVVPAARSCKSWSLRIWWASSTIALRPCWGATPAWAALPSTSRWNRPTPCARS